MTPGDLRTRLYVSSNSAYWLGVAGSQARPAFQNPLDLLLQHQDETGRFYGFLHSTWIAASVLFMAGDRYSDAASKGFQLLMDRPLSEWADSEISWTLGSLGGAGPARGHPCVGQSLADILRRRRPDASWVCEDREALTVGASIETLKVLKLYGLLPS